MIDINKKSPPVKTGRDSVLQVNAEARRRNPSMLRNIIGITYFPCANPVLLTWCSPAVQLLTELAAISPSGYETRLTRSHNRGIHLGSPLGLSSSQ